MLPYSHKPQILRLHSLEDRQRNRFLWSFKSMIQQLLPSSLLVGLQTSPKLNRLLMMLPDIYYTFTTICLCRRRLGQQYVYIAMYKDKHYENNGVLLHKKTRILLSILQLIGRHFWLPLLQDKLSRTISQRSMWKKVQSWIVDTLGSFEEIVGNVQWIVFMAYLLGWNKYFSVLETLLGIRYVYTFQNEQIKDVSYAIEGYLLLAVFVVKAIRAGIKIYKAKKMNRGVPIVKVEQEEKGPPEIGVSLCRICYSPLTNRSLTKCGHVFCWDCIIRALQVTANCPVCRTNCSPRQVLQLRN